MKDSSKKILTVDDSPTVREILRTTLQNAGFEVLQAINGQDALKMLETEKVNMLITDLNMPKLDGISLVRKVRQSPGGRFLPIIHADDRIAGGEETRGERRRRLGLDRQAVQAGPDPQHSE